MGDINKPSCLDVLGVVGVSSSETSDIDTGVDERKAAKKHAAYTKLEDGRHKNDLVTKHALMQTQVVLVKFTNVASWSSGLTSWSLSTQVQLYRGVHPSACVGDSRPAFAALSPLKMGAYLV